MYPSVSKQEQLYSKGRRINQIMYQLYRISDVLYIWNDNIVYDIKETVQNYNFIVDKPK